MMFPGFSHDENAPQLSACQIEHGDIGSANFWSNPMLSEAQVVTAARTRASCAHDEKIVDKLEETPEDDGRLCASSKVVTP